MADIVAGFGVPHTPRDPETVQKEGFNSVTGKLYQAVADHLKKVDPDVVIIFDSDHLNTFFYNNLPTFCVGVAGRTEGPNDSNTILPRRQVAIREDLSNEIYQHGVTAGFDLSLTQDFTVDHSIMVPLHFLTPQLKTPIVPVFINGVCPPLPTSKRCFALGEAVRRTVEQWPNPQRVAVIASGSFSLDVAGPKEGITDHPWMNSVLHDLGNANIEELLEKATSERMLAAGNVSGELLNWIALLGMVGKRKPVFLEPRMSHGDAYAAWRWD